MPQPFRRWTNVGSKGSILGSLLLLSLATWAGIVYVSSSYGTGAGVAPVQPIPFSHEHHAGILGIDCRYCHTTVEQSAVAGIPPTSICMKCHSQIWVGSSMLAPVRASYSSDRSITWKRVYNTPGFVYFAHNIHVQKGVGCSTCHGPVNRMPFTYQEPSLLMDWCLDCHRNPAQAVRPRDKIFDMTYVPPANQQEVGDELVKEYKIRSPHDLTSCSVCHR